MAEIRPEDIIGETRKKLNEFRYAPVAILVLLIIIGLKSTVYSIKTEEIGIIQRFGKYIHTTSPGLHIKLPFGIDKMTPVKVERVFKQEFGIRTLHPGVRTEYSSQQYHEESLMLTGDLNAIDVRWIVQFRVNDPVKLLFSTRNPVDNVRDISEVVMRRLVGDYRVGEVLTTKREEIDDLAQIEMQKILDGYNTGIKIVTIKLQDVNPPDEVKAAFNEVNEAKQERERMVNQAWEAYNKVIPKARGEAEKTIREAEGYSLDKINRAKGEAERFVSRYQAYKKSPDITRKRLYLETLTEVLPRAKEKYIIDPKQKSILPILNLKGENQ